jgi:eukaryotic-like serine/threonine-protein kinase
LLEHQLPRDDLTVRHHQLHSLTVVDGSVSDRERELAVGRVLANRYRVTRELGRGGMGAVYEAMGVRLGRRFAIKVPRTDRILHKDTLRRLEREASVGARIESSHVARVLDWDTLEDGTPFVVMEYVPGEDLRRVLERTPTLPLRRAVNLVLQACRGLAVAHAEGVVHRDLKPSNLALTPELGGYEHCTVLDFGVAKLADDLGGDGDSTRTGAIVGTLAYMPAEQIRGDKTLDGRADVYALGAIFYECLAGRRAFEATTNHELMYRILHERPTPLEQLRRGLPPGVYRAVGRAMALERE